MILTLNEFDNDRDCPELYEAFNATPIDLGQTTWYDSPQDGIEAEIEMMCHDFDLIAKHLGISSDEVWDMYIDDELTWEPPIANAS